MTTLSWVGTGTSVGASVGLRLKINRGGSVVGELMIGAAVGARVGAGVGDPVGGELLKATQPHFTSGVDVPTTCTLINTYGRGDQSAYSNKTIEIKAGGIDIGNVTFNSCIVNSGKK